jgi:hypothetical protein
VPKAVDVITPQGVSQATELDQTLVPWSSSRSPCPDARGGCAWRPWPGPRRTPAAVLRDRAPTS